MATYRTFVRGKEKYSLSEKKQLGELISNHKEKHDKESKELEGKTRYDHKQKNMIVVHPNCFARTCHSLGQHFRKLDAALKSESKQKRQQILNLVRKIT